VDKLKPSGKSFDISKWEVWEAYRQVKANRGAPGVDGVTLEQFDKDLKNNLYKIWNRMSSGSYFPPPVLAVEIPKPHGGGTRTLGVPTISDRVAQTVVARRLEAKVEPIFHPDSYGYRPYRSALDAVAACRERCWKSDWVIDLDIQKFFDSVDHALMVKAVAAHADVPWVVLYVKRWLSAPLALPDGTLRQRDRGTPQGSAVSPVLANLFMHYAFDAWMVREYPNIRFERYADDVVVHCVTERQARNLVAAIGDRMEQVGLRLHPDKTKVVYCPRREPPTRLRAHGVHVLGVHFSHPCRAHEERRDVRRVPAGYQQGRPEQDQRSDPPMATAPLDRAHPGRHRPTDQPCRARLDAVLRSVLPLRAVSTPVAHQRLRDALDPQQVQTAAHHQESQGMLAAHHPPTSPALRPLGMGARFLAARMTRAR